MGKRGVIWIAGACVLLLESRAFAAGADSGPADPIASLVLALALILVAAKVGAHFAVRIGQPPVLGELLAGVVLGNLTLV
ncbi:MAG: hypothetical protein ABJC89_19975, partial [Acidobacteriota bacterium]